MTQIVTKFIQRAIFSLGIIVLVAMLLVLFTVSIHRATMPGDDSSIVITRKSLSGHIARNSRMLFDINDTVSNTILRIIAKAGDTVTISGGYTFVNHQMLNEKHSVTSSFIISRDASPRTIHAMERVTQTTLHPTDTAAFAICMIKDEWRPLLNAPMLHNIPDTRLYPYNATAHWNAYHMGPVVIPRKGTVIRLTPRNADIYRHMIEQYEHYKLTDSDTTYTFANDYVWAMCDNRDVCNDSRMYGPIPEKCIVGKVTYDF